MSISASLGTSGQEIPPTIQAETQIREHARAKPMALAQTQPISIDRKGVAPTNIALSRLMTQTICVASGLGDGMSLLHHKSPMLVKDGVITCA